MSEAQAREALRVVSEYVSAGWEEPMRLHVELVETVSRSFVARAEDGDDSAAFKDRYGIALIVRCLPEGGESMRFVRAAPANDGLWIHHAAESIARAIAAEKGGARRMTLASEMRVPVLLSAGWCAGVWFHELVGHQLEADNVERGWFLPVRQIGERIAQSALTVTDVPGKADQPGYLTVDDEASAGTDTVLIDSGRVAGLLHDRRTAAAFRERPTGNGRRQDYRYPAQPRMTNLVVQAGDSAVNALTREYEKCVRVRSLSHGVVDGQSGRFSFVVDRADVLESGEPSGLIVGATIGGTVAEALGSIVMIGNDSSSADGRGRCVKNGQTVDVGLISPSILVEELSIRPR